MNKYIQLPYGYIDCSGIVHKEVVIRALSGREEEMLAGSSGQSGAQLSTLILSCCVQKIGTVGTVTPSIIRNLSIGDRNFLLLKIREITFGSKISAVVPCPWHGCGAKMDIDFNIEDIPVRAGSKPAQKWYTISLVRNHFTNPDSFTETVEMNIRVPDGEDQEVISPLLEINQVHASKVLLSRCISYKGDSGDSIMKIVDNLTSGGIHYIEQQIEELSPAVDMTIETNCPQCKRAFDVPLNIQDFFFGELKISKHMLRREVHYLAYHYHWSEQEIMSFPRDTRREYIEILGEEIERINSEANEIHQ